MADGAAAADLGEEAEVALADSVAVAASQVVGEDPAGEELRTQD